MLYTEEFIESLNSDPLTGTIRIIEIAKEKLGNNDSEWLESDYEILIEAYSLVVELLESGVLPLEKTYPELCGHYQQDCITIMDFLAGVSRICTSETENLKVQSLRSRFRITLGHGFAYEFSQGDLMRIQTLVNELRDLISTSMSFDRDHIQRLLRRLEKLQGELHKKVSDLDRFWGLIGDAGIVLGKFGNDAKPIIDRIREITDIVWLTQTRAEELPSGAKLPSLEHFPHQEGDQT